MNYSRPCPFEDFSLLNILMKKFEDATLKQFHTINPMQK